MSETPEERAQNILAGQHAIIPVPASLRRDIVKEIRAAVAAERERLVVLLQDRYDQIAQMTQTLELPLTEARRAKLAGFRQAIIELEATAIREGENAI